MRNEREMAGICRRALMHHVFFLAATSCMLGIAAPRRGSAAERQMTQKDAEYQPTPKNGQSCATCQFFNRPAACKIVKGKISPQGWCAFFASKPPG